MKSNELQLKRASNAALMSLLNLTVFPIVGFVALLFMYMKTAESGAIDCYYVVLGIKTNLIAGAALVVVTGLMILLGGFDSPWTWVYVVSYFVFVHALFILFATWALTRSWTGEKLKKSFLSK
jgi:hypothetical protein